MLLLAQETSRPLIQFSLAPLFQENGIPLAVMGVAVVFTALALLSGFIAILPKLLTALGEPDLTVTPQLADGEEQLSEELVVVISAAVAAVVAQPHRVVRIRGLTPEDLGWSLEGRMQQHHSHTIRRDRR